jgi:hypothetical protein
MSGYVGPCSYYESGLHGPGPGAMLNPYQPQAENPDVAWSANFTAK